MLHFTDPTYVTISSQSEWLGTTRYGTFPDACEAAQERAKEDGCDWYVARLEATAVHSTKVDVVDIYGATWR